MISTHENGPIGPAISGSTRVVGVCGQGIGYTLSPAMHNAAFRHCGLDYVYVTFEIAATEVRRAVDGIRGLGLAGVNVTKPLKTDVLPYLDEVSEEARRIGSVNTIANRSGCLAGTSTDGAGLLRALGEEGVAVAGSRMLILGAGGAARAACAMARGQGAASITIAARNADRARDTASVGGAEAIKLSPSDLGAAVREADLVINAIPRDLTLEGDWFTSGQFVYDTRYDQAETGLMRIARSRGAATSNGIGMLLFQGAASFEIWTGRAAPVEVMKSALEEQLRRRKAREE
ncbi:MAG: shikimate dehydrogenase [Gemmatimonadetes bacterium]|nr:shikimate dehydrogenase [Gemmatimonadota bacterium]MYD27099.1 shikimate dehydrogenase [Gemmatimonadota bacterium]MYI98070.1 shikimate dehydrogenase [Gemmatimonadota bacterium]